MTETIKFPNGTMQAVKLSDGSDGYGGLIKIPRLLKPSGQKVRLRVNTNKRKDNSPDYWVETPCWDSSEKEWYWAASGSAWFKAPKAEPDGEKFFSIDLDMADMPSKIPAAAFIADADDQPKAGEGGKLYRFTYSRPRQRRAGAGGGSAPRDAAPVLQDDSINF